VLLPLLGFSAFLVMRSAEREQDAIAAAARNRTRIAATVISDEIGALRGRLFLLAGGLSPETSDLSEFHARAKAAFGGMTVILSSASGQEIVNTSVPFGTVLPEAPDPDAIRLVAQQQQPHVADLPRDPVTHRPVITINVPVTQENQPVYVLSLDITSTLPRILGELDIPDGWIAGIFDPQGYQIGRNMDPEPYLGQPARDEFIRHMHAEDAGWVPGKSREGMPVFNAFVHTRPTGWVVDVAIPHDVLLAPVRQTTRSLLLLGGAIVSLAVVLAVTIGRRIAAPVIGLVPIAEAVGRGEPVVPRLTWLREANVVVCSLHGAGEQLRLAATERDASTAALSQSEQMYRALAEDLARVDEERTALLTRVVVAQEHERQRIARELHDSLAQYLTAIRLKLDTLGRSGASMGEVLNELRSMIGELGRSVNRMAWELRPVALDNLGLHSAIDHYLEEWAEMAGLQVDVQIDLGGRSLPPAVEATLFRVLQEAMTNVTRHADATRVGVILETKDDLVQLIVEDNGRGFPADDSKWPFAATRKFGLHGMRERLALVHGTLDVESAPQAGTTLFVSIPLGRVSLGPGLEAS
ncbi:MAG TPA: ATP-binding protein, partial [Acetobacteraceae bacterium]|nr:ATP-binding protein [Acetobacteraceae bacterium]